VRQVMGSLQGGGWIGQGAGAFYAEMEGIVFPGMGRLSEAMAQAQSAVLQIRDIIKQAEEEASAPFRGAAVPASAGVDSGAAGVTSPGGAGPGGSGRSRSTAPTPSGGGTISPGSGPGRTPRPDSGGSVEDWLAERPMIGFGLFGIVSDTKGLVTLLKTGKAAVGALHAVPIVGGILDTTLGIMDANARGENMDFAVGREITKGTLKTEVYLVPGLNVVAGGLELAHMFGVTKRNYTNVAVNAVAEPVHKYVLNPASDLLADGLVQILPPWPW